MKNSNLNFDIMGDCVIDHSVDHDILTQKTKQSSPDVKIQKDSSTPSKPRPEIQIQIVEV
jgi:hypothetical protein